MSFNRNHKLGFIHKPSKITLALGASLMALAISQPLSAEQASATAKAKSKKTDVWQSGFFHKQCPGTAIVGQEFSDQGQLADVEADDINRLADDTTAFEGNVLLVHSTRRLSADSARLKEQKEFTAQGNVRYQDPLLRVAADKVAFDMEQGKGSIEELEFQLQASSMRGKAKQLTIDEQRNVNMTQAEFSSCPADAESWKLSASQIEMDEQEGWGTADDVTLRIGDIPVIYFPTMSFPIDDRRKTGFLYPKLGRSDRLGIEVEAPWYWNIAPEMDATIVPRYLSDRGTMLGAEFRALTEDTENKFYFEYLGDDKKGLPGQEQRFIYQLKTDYAPDPYWRGNLNISSVSDDDYFYDFGGSFNTGNRNLVRRVGSLSYNNEYLSFLGIFSNDKLLNTPFEPYTRLPELNLDLFTPGDNFGFNSKLSIETTSFRHDEKIEADRLVVAPEMSYPMNWASGYITPTFKYHYSRYRQDDPQNLLADSVTRSLPIFSVDSAVVFERELDIADKSITQTLEPRLFYLNVPKRDQNEIGIYDTASLNGGLDSLFRDNRYTGIDRIGDTNQISLAVSSRFYDNSTGKQRLAVTLGRSYYFDDREVNLAVYPDSQVPVDLGVDTRDNSALITQLELNLYDNWSIKGELEYDHDASKTEKGVLGFHYKSDAWIVNLNHRVHRFASSETIEQAELSLQLPLTENLRLVSRWQKDIENDRTIDQFAGLEYEGCCWAMRLVARRYLNVRLDQSGNRVPGSDDFNDGIYLEFILKGLTNIGKSLNLTEDIQGYEDRFKR